MGQAAADKVTCGELPDDLRPRWKPVLSMDNSRLQVASLPP
jgi:hypothetical protein